MKVSSTELPSRQVSLAIEVEQDRLDRAMDDAFRRLAGRVNVPGFRRGKAPRTMVERMIGRERIVEEALDSLLPQVVSEAIEQEKVEPYTRPRVESIEFEPLRLKAVVGLPPKVELGDYQGNLHVPTEEVAVGDEQIDSVIQRLRDSYAQWTPVERAVQLGDRVGLDLKATVDGADTPILDSKEAEYVADPAGAQPAPGFAEQLIGMEPGGAKTFTLTMADDYRDKDVAGRPAQFEVLLHWVKERELPAVDEAFVQQVGEYTDVAGLRKAIEEQLRGREEQRIREQLEESAINKLVEISTIDYPPQLVEHQAEHMMESFARNVEQQGLQLAQYLRLLGKDQADFESEMRSEAENRVRRSLALDAFADAEGIDVGQKEIEDEVHRAAASVDNPEVAEKQALADASTMQRVQEATRERKAMARLIELATRNGASPASSDSGSAGTSTTEKPENPADRTETTDTGQTSRAEAATVEERPANA